MPKARPVRNPRIPQPSSRGSSSGISRLPATEEDQMRLGIELFASRKANMWNIGTVASVPRPCIYHQGSSNVAVAAERKHYYLNSC